MMKGGTGQQNGYKNIILTGVHLTMHLMRAERDLEYPAYCSNNSNFLSSPI